MTRYSVSSEISPQILATPTTDNYQIEVDSSDWESKMAELVGLEKKSLTVDVEPSEDSAISQPQAVPTEQPLSSNPFAKLGLVGTATFAIVLLAGGFLSQMMSTNNPKQKKNNLISPVAQSQPKSDSHQQNLEQEVETLKTKLALSEQADELIAAQQNLRNRPISVPRLTVRQTPLATAKNRLEMTPQIAYIPPTMTVDSTIKPSLQMTPIPPTPVVAPNIQPSPPNPLDEWTKLAKLGSYGQVYATNQPNISTTSYKPENNTNVDNVEPPVTPQKPTSLVSQAQPQSQKSVPAGVSAKAVLATALFGETTRSRENDKNENKNVFVIRLKEPLKAVDGGIALPANTEFLTEISSISEQGFLQLDVVKIISKNNGNLTETSLPKNAIIIRAPQGRPLIANKFPNSSSSIASMDLGLFVLGGIGKAAELFNRTEGQVVTTTGGVSSITNNNPQRNILAGVVEGGLNSVVPQISQRNQQAIAQMMQQSNIWFMPAGTKVEIYVNQIMQF